jgi:hypothetical protein
MNQPLTNMLIPALMAFLGSLLGVLLTPRLQHRFWKNQRREEMRLTVANEVNRLAAEASYGYRFRTIIPDCGFGPNEPFLISLEAVGGQVEALFSHSTYQAFETLRQAILESSQYFHRSEKEPDTHVARRIDQVRNALLTSIYQEVGILPTSPTTKTKLLKWVRPWRQGFPTNHVPRPQNQ